MSISQPGLELDRLVLRSLPSAILVLSPRGEVRIANPAACELLGWEESALLSSLEPFPFCQPAALPSLEKALHAGNAERGIPLNVRKQDGIPHAILFSARPLHDKDGNSIGWAASLRETTGLERLQQVFRDRERFIDNIVHSVPEVIYVYDLRTRSLEFLNSRAASLLGFIEKEIFDESRRIMKNLLHPDDAVHFPASAVDWGSLHERAIVRGEVRLLAAGGDYRLFETHSAVLIRDAHGEVTHLVGAAQEITEKRREEEARRQIEQDLRESERLYRLLAENATDIIARIDRDGRFLFVSPACYRLLGYNPTELVGRSLYELMDPGDRDRVFRVYARVLRDGVPQTVTYRMRRRDMSNLWFETRTQIIPPASEEGTGVELLAVCREVSDRVHAVEALRRSEELFRALVERSSDGIAMLGEAGDVRYVSPSATRLLGYSLEELVNVPPTQLVHAEDLPRLAEDARRLAEAGPGISTRGQIRIRHRGGAVRTFEYVATNQLDDPYINAHVVNFRDITDRIELENQLRQVQKIEAVGQLAGGIAHDFNNILTAIIGQVALLKETKRESDPERHTLDGVDRAARRAADLTRRLLGYSRRTALRLKSIDLNRIVQETLELLRPTIDPRIRFETKLQDFPWAVLADTDQLSQVFTNLCLNARDAMPRGGHLTIATRKVRIDDAYVRSVVHASPGEYMRISVLDTGVGMSPEVISRLFEPFFTTKPIGQGTGLGLAMVYGIIKSHNGWVTCESEEGAGTRFDLFIPRTLQPIDQALSQLLPAAAPHKPAAGELILVVDDEPSLRELSRAILEKAGYKVVLAEDGQAAVDCFPEIAQKVRLVLLDMTMPRLSGPDAFRELRKLKPNLPVLFCSGYSAEQLDGLDPDAAFLPKPFRPDMLLEAVRIAMR